MAEGEVVRKTQPAGNPDACSGFYSLDSLMGRILEDLHRSERAMWLWGSVIFAVFAFVLLAYLGKMNKVTIPVIGLEIDTLTLIIVSMATVLVLKTWTLIQQSRRAYNATALRMLGEILWIDDGPYNFSTPTNWSDVLDRLHMGAANSLDRLAILVLNWVLQWVFRWGWVGILVVIGWIARTEYAIPIYVVAIYLVITASVVYFQSLYGRAREHLLALADIVDCLDIVDERLVFNPSREKAAGYGDVFERVHRAIVEANRLRDAASYEKSGKTRPVGDRGGAGDRPGADSGAGG